MEQISAYIGAIVAAIFTAFFTARKTTNGITGNIESHLKPKDDNGKTLRMTVDEIEDNVNRVLDGIGVVDRRLLQTEGRMDDRFNSLDDRLDEQGEQIKAVSERVTGLERKKSA